MFTSSRRAFYLLNRPDFADFVNYFSFRPRGFVQAIGGRRSNPRSERNPIIHGMSKVLLAAKVTFRCLHGRVTEQKLNLLQFSAARVTQLRTCPPQIMGCNMLQPRTFATLSYHAPHQILRDTFPPYFPAPGDGTKYPSFLDSSSCYPPIHCVFHPLRNRDSANSSAFAGVCPGWSANRKQCRPWSKHCDANTNHSHFPQPLLPGIAIRPTFIGQRDRVGLALRQKPTI